VQNDLVPAMLKSDWSKGGLSKLKPANICVFKLTNQMLVMLKKLKLSLKILKIKSSMKTKKI
jgi:hypothetical protein